VTLGDVERTLLPLERTRVRSGQPGAAVLGGPGDGSVSGVELGLLPLHALEQELPLLFEGQVVEHRHVVRSLAPPEPTTRRAKWNAFRQPGAARPRVLSDVRRRRRRFSVHESAEAAAAAAGAAWGKWRSSIQPISITLLAIFHVPSTRRR